MTLPRSVADVLCQHVTLEVEGIDRMYLNVYQPRLQTDRGVAAFFRFHRGETFASSVLMDPISKAFIAAVEHFVEREQIPLITFAKGQRKDDVAKEHHARFQGTEGIVFVGKAQEKTPVFGTEKRRNPDTGQKYPWIVRRTAMVNHFYFYGLDEDFGPFFLKVCTYFPYNAKLCINGHEYVKRHRLRGPGQRRPELCRSETAPATLRRPLGRQDRRAFAEVAGATAPPVHREGPRGRLPLRRVDPPG
jgi:hypothetical protein